jgi:hypothetical protein
MNRKDTPDNRWLVPLLLLYVAVELAFNHRLLVLTTTFLSEGTLRGVEFWGRIISGVGLALLAWRLVRHWLDRPLLSLALSLALGITTMWHVQQFIVDELVARAPRADKEASLVLLQVADYVATGHASIEGRPLGAGGMPNPVSDTVKSIFPASALFIDNRQQVALALLQESGLSGPGLMPGQIPHALSDTAYRNVVVPPIALGLSIFFAISNICQIMALLLCRLPLFRALPLFGTTGHWLLKPLIGTALMLMLVGFTARQGNAFVSSDAYVQLLQSTMWRGNSLIALFTDWTLRAEPLWYGVTEWTHRYVLADLPFSHPWR